MTATIQNRTGSASRGLSAQAPLVEEMSPYGLASPRGWLSKMIPRRCLLASLLQGAPRNSICRQVSSWAPFFSAQRWSFRFPLLYELWHELCNVPRRIAALHDIGAEDGIDFRIVSGRECPARSDEYRSRSEGIQNLRKARPWASLLDVATFLEGHAAGVGFGSHNCIPKSSGSSRHPAVPQCSKRDRLAPLPLQG